MIAAMNLFSSQSSNTMRAILVDEHNCVAVAMLHSLLTSNPNDSSFLEMIVVESALFAKDT